MHKKRDDRNEPNRVEMFVLTHTKKDGTPIDDRSKQIMVIKYLNFIYLYFNHSYILNYLYNSNNYFCFL